MEKKLVKSQYGIWVDVYEVEHEGKILWFREYEIESAARRYENRVAQEDDLEDEPHTIHTIRRYD